MAFQKKKIDNVMKVKNQSLLNLFRCNFHKISCPWKWFPSVISSFLKFNFKSCSILKIYTVNHLQWNPIMSLNLPELELQKVSKNISNTKRHESLKSIIHSPSQNAFQNSFYFIYVMVHVKFMPMGQSYYSRFIFC